MKTFREFNALNAAVAYLNKMPGSIKQIAKEYGTTPSSMMKLVRSRAHDLKIQL